MSGGTSLTYISLSTYSFGVIVWQILEWRLPFDCDDSDLSSEETLSVRERLRDGQLPWGENEMKDDERSELKPIILECWQAENLRLPSSYVAQRLGHVFTRYRSRSETPFSTSFPERQLARLSQIRNQTMHVVKLARNEKAKLPQDNQISNDDVRFLLESLQAQFNPVTSFLLGAAIWWQLTPFDGWDDDFQEAYDLQLDGILPALFLHF
jgi:hypothetical protein